MPNASTVRAPEEPREITADGTLNKAFQLAYSIYRYRECDREIALKILWEALRSVEVRLMAQHEADRHQPQNPSKVRWNTAQWFQLLIYYKSERFERAQEANQPLGEADMMIRYIKHLLLMTCRRNSFHISLGIGRLLYNYTAAETMTIYDLVFQDPDSSTRKADAYYRARKNKLIEEMEIRFRGFVRVCQGVRGAKRFQSESYSDQLLKLVWQALTSFTPWETHCELPEHLDIWTPVSSLQSSQTNQIHSLIHPSCFLKITQALKLAAPETRLALPRFFLTREQGNQTSPPANPSPPSALNEEELATIRQRLVEESQRRRRFSPHSLCVLADGVERARLDLAQSSRVRFDVEEDVTVIELMGHTASGEILLASHILSPGEYPPDTAEAEEYSIVLEGGQKISLVILMANSETAAPTVEIRYEETLPARAAALWWRRLERRLSDQDYFKNWRPVPAWSLKIAIALLALTAAGTIVHLALRNGPRGPQELAQQLPPAPAIMETRTPTGKGSAQPNSSPTKTPRIPLAARPHPARPGSGSQRDVITREQSPSASRSLLSIERVYIQSLGADPFSETVRQRLAEHLRAVNRFVITANPDEADTAVTGSARRQSNDPNTGTVYMEFVNVSGEVLWRSRRHRGTAERVSAGVTKDFLDAIQAESRPRVRK